MLLGVQGQAQGRHPGVGGMPPQDNPAEILVGLFALGKQHLHQMLRSLSDGSSLMGMFQSNKPAKPFMPANRSPGRKGFLIKPRSQSEQILRTCNRMHLTCAKLNHIWIKA